jgi:hypothetical protein
MNLEHRIERDFTSILSEFHFRLAVAACSSKLSILSQLSLLDDLEVVFLDLFASAQKPRNQFA